MRNKNVTKICNPLNFREVTKSCTIYPLFVYTRKKRIARAYRQQRRGGGCVFFSEYVKFLNYFH